MSSVKELKAILRQHKKNSPGCAPYSKLRKAELLNRVKNLDKECISAKIQTAPLIPANPIAVRSKQVDKRILEIENSIKPIIKKLKINANLTQLERKQIRNFLEVYKKYGLVDLYNELAGVM